MVEVKTVILVWFVMFFAVIFTPILFVLTQGTIADPTSQLVLNLVPLIFILGSIVFALKVEF